MKISDAGIALIKSHEGLRLKAYPDPGTGGEPWTIGYGHTGGVEPGDEIDQNRADEYLRCDVMTVEDCVEHFVNVSLTQGQFDALCSFVFNVGCKAFSNSTLCRLLNEGNYEGARQQFSRWTKAGGRDLPGLVRRRKEEAELFA